MKTPLKIGKLDLARILGEIFHGDDGSKLTTEFSRDWTFSRYYSWNKKR